MIELVFKIAVGLYALSVVAMAGGFVMDEMSFTNPRYGRAIIYAVLWLPLLIYFQFLVPMFEES